MTDKANIKSHDENQPFPENPGAAMLVGMLFMKLGGTLTVGSDGERWVGQIEPVDFTILGEEFPQLPGAKPHEQFLSVEQWCGATRMLGYLVQRLDPADKDYIFSMLGSIGVDPRTSFDFREHLK